MKWQHHTGRDAIFLGCFFFLFVFFMFLHFFFRNGKFAKGAVSTGRYVVDACCKILLMDW